MPAFWEGFLNWQRRKCNLALKIMVTQQGDSWRDSPVMQMGIGKESERQIPKGAEHTDCWTPHVNWSCGHRGLLNACKNASKSSLRPTGWLQPIQDLVSVPHSHCHPRFTNRILVAPPAKGGDRSYCQPLHNLFRGSDRPVFFLSTEQNWKHRWTAIQPIRQNKNSFSEVWFVD